MSEDNNNQPSLKPNENELNDINTEKTNKLKHNTIINRNRGHSDFGHQLTYNKKLENELDTLPNDINKFFRQSLDKYNFQLEVYVPHSMVISKKEYYNKNYMLNHLVRTEDIIKGRKNQIAHISKETKKFSHQYEFVQNKNMNHQLDYLSKIEKMYKNKGYNITGINYKKDDNIFTPSFLLDTKYGNNSHADIVKYGQNNYKKDYKKDKWLLNKFDEFIQKKNKGNKGRGKDINDNQMKNNEDNILEEDNEKIKLLAQLKRELDEQIKIQNMTKEEYLEHTKKMKEEIQSIKDTINNSNDLNEYFNKNKNDNNRNNKLSKSIDIKKNESYKKENSNNDNDKSDSNSKKIKQKIFDFNSNIFLSSKGIKEYSKDKSDILPEINNLKKNNTIKINNNNNKMTLEKRIGLKKNNIESKNNKIPKLFIKESLNNNINTVYLSERKLKEMQKEKHLTQLYDTLNNRASNSIFPYKQINHYFNKYSKRRIPVANTDRGSNIHGLVEDVQNIINENNFAGFAKLNYNAKKDIQIKNKKEDSQNNNNKELDDDYIIDLDNKILGMHYDFTDNLLSNKKDQFYTE